METAWFFLLAGMLTTYVVLDGFDFGAGILHLAVARTDRERRTVLGAIGPLWDGNEVWLIAAGGLLVFAFPRAYSAGFSGFYMPLMMVLWLLILRGISIEFRSHEANALWRSFWDGCFTFASVLLGVFLGAALGNVIRGVPLDQTGFFAGPLFTDFRPGRFPGVLDWYTVLIGLFTTAALAGHGALYLNWKTDGPVQERSRALAPRCWAAAMVLLVLATAATAVVQPVLFARIGARPWAWPLVLVMLASLALIPLWLRQRRELPAFLASAAFLASMLAATAAGLYPKILTSTLAPEYDLDVANAAAGALALRIGFLWWSPAVLLAIGYFIYLFRSFRGKVRVSDDGHGY
jgi:cytochrome d ubiquinol oxidase subunit II